VAGVVGTCGTVLTDEHVAQLKRFTDTLHFAFDADAAGMKATIAATQAALAAGMRVATVVLPEGKDPADVAADPAELKKLVAEPQSLVSVLIQRLQKAEGDAGARQGYLEALVPLLAATRNPVQLGEMVREVAELLKIPESRVVRLLEEAPSPDFAESLDEEEAHVRPQAHETERYTLGLVIGLPAVREALLAELNEGLFREMPAQQLYRALVALAREASWATLPADELLAQLPAELVSYAEGVRALSAENLAKSQLSAHAEAEALISSLKRRHLKGQLSDLQGKLLVGDDTERTHILKQFHSLTQELARLKTS
jgi:DNA primase